MRDATPRQRLYTKIHAAVESEGVDLSFEHDELHEAIDEVVRIVEKRLQEAVEKECCTVCGEPYFTDEAGCTHHIGEDCPDGIDYDADADHVPYGGPG